MPALCSSSFIYNICIFTQVYSSYILYMYTCKNINIFNVNYEDRSLKNCIENIWFEIYYNTYAFCMCVCVRAQVSLS